MLAVVRPYSRGERRDRSGVIKLGGFDASSHNAGVSYTRVIAPIVINEVRFGSLPINYYRAPNYTFDPSSLTNTRLIVLVSGLGGLPTSCECGTSDGASRRNRFRYCDITRRFPDRRLGPTS